VPCSPRTRGASDCSSPAAPPVRPRSDGFTVALAAHAFSVLDAYTYGFVLTEVNLPFEPGTADEFIDEIAAALADRPWMAELVAERITGKDYAYGDEFEHGLTLVLDGIEAAFAALGG
jgi:hypothetical protein